MVDFVAGSIDEGAPEINVNGVIGIERVSPNEMRVTYFRRRKGELVAVAHLVWDRDEWLQMWNIWEENRVKISQECFGKEKSGMRMYEIH
jgi:hypothetical protein